MLLHPGSRPVPNYPDYLLVRNLGAGAFGEVWHVHGPGGLDVALKFIPLDSNVRAVELRSLDVMKSIRHPNLGEPVLHARRRKPEPAPIFLSSGIPCVECRRS